MGRKRPDRTERRARERAARELVRDREKLAALSRGGSAERPLEIPSPVVIEGRVRALPCVQCEGEYAIKEHRSAGPGVRAIDVRCHRCGVPRTLWFRIVSPDPN